MRNDVGCLLCAEVSKTCGRGGDHGNLEQHGFGHRQSKAFSPGGMAEDSGRFIETDQLPSRDVAVDMQDLRGARIDSAELPELLRNRVVNIRKRLEHEDDVIVRGEDPDERSNEKVHTLSWKC